MAMAGQYAPIASGVPFTPSFGFEGVPFLGENPMLGMIMQPILSQAMGGMGMSPMGLNDRNAFDTLNNQRFFRQTQEIQRRMAESDRQNWMRTMRGVAYMTGTPWGADQMRAARGFADTAISMSPTFNMIAPEIVDEMAGYRGSAAVMAGRMMMAGRYRIDPVTGRMGQNPEHVAAQAKSLYRDLYENGNLRDMQGISAGQLGTLYEQLAQRGLIGGSTQSPYDQVKALAGSDPQLLRDAAGRAGFNIPRGPNALLERAAGAVGLSQLLPVNTQRLSGDQLDKLTMDPGVGDKLRSFDTERVKKSLQDYLHAVNAVKDIFGDMGRPNAPMAQLIGALEAMTNGSMTQIQPGQLNMMVRMTHQLAQSTGVGLDNALVMQEHLSGRARQMGLESVFAVHANQGGMAFGAAFRAEGLPPAWGRMNADQMTQLDGQLRLNAAASKAAQRGGLAIRLSDRLGGFAEGSDAARYVAGLKTAQDTGFDHWIDSQGNQRSLNLDQGEFTQVMTASGKVSASQLNTMLAQKFANREFIQQYNLGDVYRRSQGKRDIQPWVSSHLQGFLQGQLRQAGVGEKEAREAAAAIAREAAGDIMGIDQRDFADNDKRTERMGQILQRRLAGTAAGAALGDRLGGFSRLTGESFKGFMDDMTRLSPDLGYLGNFQNVFTAFNSNTLSSGTRIQTTERLNAQIRDALAPLNRGSMTRRAMGYLQNAKEGDATLAKMVGTMIGGVNEKDVSDNLLPVMQRVRQEQEALEGLQRQIVNETNPTRKQELLKQFQERVAALKGHVGAATETFGRMGVTDDALTTADTTRARNLTTRVGEMTGEIDKIFQTPDGGGAPGAAEIRRRFGEFWKTDSGTVYRDAVREQGAAASDVAMKLLSSQASIDRLGLGGIEHADAITAANRELLQLAAVHTGGDVSRLIAGDFAAGMPAVERKQLADRVRQHVTMRDTAVKSIYDMQQQTGRVWGDHAKMAAALGVSVADVTLASQMDPNLVKAALEANEMAVGTTGRDAAMQKLVEQWGGKAGPDLDNPVTADDLVQASGVFQKLRGKAADSMATENAKPEQLARDFLKRYGVDAADSDADKARLDSIGKMLKTEAGQALYAGLTAGQDYLATVAKQGGLGGVKPVEQVDALYKEYQNLLQTPEADRTGAEKAFKAKFKLGDSDFSQFQRAIQLQTETGFIRFGDSGLGQRTDFSLAKAEEMLGRKLATGTLGGEERKVKVEFPNGMEISGRLKLDGSLEAKSTGANTPGMNYANTGGN